MNRFGKTEELVGAAIYLASDAATFVTGEILVVDGGPLASGVESVGPAVGGSASFYKTIVFFLQLIAIGLLLTGCLKCIAIENA